MPRGRHSVLGVNARVGQYGIRKDALRASRMMYGAAPQVQRMQQMRQWHNMQMLQQQQQMAEGDRYGAWYNPLSWGRKKKPEPVYGDEDYYYEDEEERELAMNPHRYDLEGFNVTAEPKEEIYGIFDSIPRKSKTGSAKRKSKRREVTLL